MKLRIPPVAIALAALIGFAVGCGGGSTATKVDELAPPGVPVFVEGKMQPTGELKSNADAIAERVAGIDNLGEYVVEKLESSARDEGEPIDFTKEIEPWLGQRAGAFFEQLEEDNDFSGAGAIVESTDADATQEFIDAQVKASDDPYKAASYEGVDFEVGGSEGNAIGVVGDFLVVAEGEKVFTEVVDASKGESLGTEETFTKAISAASPGSLVDVYVDVGELIDQSGGQISPTVRQIFEGAGVNLGETTAVASIVPRSDHVEVGLSSDLGGQEAAVGTASSVLGLMSKNAFAGFAVSGFAKQLKEAIDSLDKEGIPGTVPPGKLKSGLKELGIDLEAIAEEIQDAAVFAVGEDERSLGGALVLPTTGSAATGAVSNIAQLLRGVHVAGVTPLPGKYNGFTVHSSELGPKPLVVAAKTGRFVIGYGVPATINGLLSESRTRRSLADNPAFGEAVSALGKTPIAGFVDGPAALNLADSMIPSTDEGFEEAKKYLKSIGFLALGVAEEGNPAKAKLIIGLK